MNHGFNDGNKRTALLCIDYTIQKEFSLIIDSDIFYELILDIAEHKIDKEGTIQFLGDILTRNKYKLPVNMLLEYIKLGGNKMEIMLKKNLESRQETFSEVQEALTDILTGEKKIEDFELTETGELYFNEVIKKMLSDSYGADPTKAIEIDGEEYTQEDVKTVVSSLKEQLTPGMRDKSEVLNFARTMME